MRSSPRPGGHGIVLPLSTRLQTFRPTLRLWLWFKRLKRRHGPRPRRVAVPRIRLWFPLPRLTAYTYFMVVLISLLGMVLQTRLFCTRGTPCLSGISGPAPYGSPLQTFIRVRGYGPGVLACPPNVHTLFAVMVQWRPQVWPRPSW